jgi:predicted SnoaL-like aldol condensation-catalyzing enzyme
MRLYAKFIAPTFIHHNQGFKGDRESLNRYGTGARREPQQAHRRQARLEDGDFVITPSLVVQTTRRVLGRRSLTCSDSGNQVVELWDLGQL